MKDRHIIQFSDQGWTIQHPLSERLNDTLFNCELSYWDGPMVPTGQFELLSRNEVKPLTKEEPNPFSFYIRTWGGKDASDNSWWVELCVGDRPATSYPETDTIIFSVRFNERDWPNHRLAADEHAHLLKNALGLTELREGL
jgi:hypothetical protein